VAETKTAAQISVSSTPDKADIEIDGNFVGNTPSSIEVAPGTHSVTVRKAGYQPWQRNVKVSGGTVNIAAELQR
jgi:diacylglycerol kinase family enzyme